MRPANLLCFLLPIAILSVVSCKKKDDAPECRITSATYTSTSPGSSYTTNYTLSYDNTGRLLSTAKLTNGNSRLKTFTYSGNTIIAD